MLKHKHNKSLQFNVLFLIFIYKILINLFYSHFKNMKIYNFEINLCHTIFYEVTVIRLTKIFIKIFFKQVKSNKKNLL